ncbi:ABC transporter substrate-binding protein [Synechococcus sp. YX-04-1]|uniref:ABC transporter substrate-binding protein n=1 Tax=Synechococcus sp. YX-04-1 TaxID=3062778 RepID=UPI0026E38B8C|nr:ABC transporter substrate-binding protein [Synechococcus sp. YX-04-1]MDO6353201.1 ABC transporter substrate-binding protein [Synechococcus sp. YX-04-1]
MLLFLGGHLRRSSGITLTCWALLSSGLLTLLQPRPVTAQPPLGEEDPSALVLGQSLPLSGPSAQLGLDYRRGALAWFEAVNREGGIHGRKIKLISLDDKYEPPQTLINTRQLLKRNDLLALFGYVGTPTTKVALPLIEAAKVPLVAPMTGASLLRRPELRMVFNMRTSYRQEIAAMVDELVRDAHHRIAIVYQDDAFGQDGLDGALAALNSHGLKPLVITTVQRNSDQVGKALDDLMAVNPNGIVLVSAYVSSAALSTALRDRGSKAQIMNVSFVGTQALQKAMPVGEANGIGVAQVVPFPWNRWIPVVADYQRCLRLSDKASGFGFTSFEGYLAARMITEGLERAGNNPTRQSLVQALESIRDLDLGGFRLQLGRNDHDASDFVELTFLGSQSWEP